MCDTERALQVELRLRELEQWRISQLLHEDIDHAHVHDGYVTTARLREQVDGCLAAAAAEIEAESEQPAEESEGDGEEEKPVEAKEESEEKKDEKGPESQGQPERRHPLHHRVGGKRQAA